MIEQTSPDSRVVDVAVRVLESRLRAVVHALPPAARHADDDVEHVHDLRVVSRRALSALHVFADLVPKRRGRWLIRALERIRKAAGTARDTDVLLTRWRLDERVPHSVLRDIERRRRRVQKPLIEIDQRYVKSGRLARRIGKLVAKVAARGRKASARQAPRFGAWADGVLATRVEALFAASRESSTSPAALHHFRIAGKELRYSIEVLAGAFPGELARDIYPVIEELQGKTGKITDQAIACARLRKRLDRPGSRHAAVKVARLLRAQEARRDEATRAFYAWWTPERSAELHDHFLKLRPCSSA